MPRECSTCDIIALTAQSMKVTALATGAVSTGMSFILGASLSLLYGLINMVQMYVHYPLFNVIFPGNIFSILKVFISIAQLDLFTDENTYSNTLNYNPIYGMEELNERFDLLGYDTQSMVYNLGDLSLIQFWIFIKLIYLGIYFLLSKT